MTMFGWDDHSGMASGAGWLSAMMVASSAKSAAVLAAGALAALTLRRRSAAARHLAWSIAVVGALGVPVLAVALPAWRLAPAMARLDPEPAGPRTVADRRGQDRRRPGAGSGRSRPRPTRSRRSRRPRSHEQPAGRRPHPSPPLDRSLEPRGTPRSVVSSGR